MTLIKSESLEEKIARVVREHVEICPYDPAWPGMFAAEKAHFLACLPRDLILQVEHYGSTAVPGLDAKPVVDMLVLVRDLETIREKVPPVLEAQGYDYFWRPTSGDYTPPFYAWFIKRDPQGQRTHHIHMVESGFPQCQGLVFRDYLREFPETARAYARLKRKLAAAYPGDRVAYTREKTGFIRHHTQKARAYFGLDTPGPDSD